MAIENWCNPDDDIREVRNGPYHFVYSKVMCWVALDRGITIARRFGFNAPLDRWTREREEIRSQVLSRGFSNKLNSFVQRFDTEILNASRLILPLVNFLPISDHRIQGAIEACRTHLMKNGFTRCYLADNRLVGEEGGLLLCNFWMIECLALSGKMIEAEELLGVTMNATNDLGLFAKEYDPRRKEMFGNFPQAFSHIGYINAIAALLSGKLPAKTQDTELFPIQRMQRLLPLRRTLNQTQEPAESATEKIDGRLDARLKVMPG